MNKSFLSAVFLIVGLFGTVQQAQADIFVGHLVRFDSQSRIVGGIAETYVTYDVYNYYEPGAFGWLFYTNPTQTIDQDGGFGVNRYLYSYFPGYRADFTTNDYRVNKVLCTYSEHYLRRRFTPTPFQWSDPYGVDTMTPLEYDAPEATIYNSSQFAETLTSNEISLVGIGRPICIRTPTVESVTFEMINSQVTPDNPASLGGGSRIFPDKQSPADTTERRTVRVRARLAQSGGSPTYTQGAPVYFRNFDVDDPSADPIIDPMGSAGNDNNGSPQAGTLSGGSDACPTTYAGILCRRTDANGFATLDFTTTMQPGDNFVIAASTDDNYLNGVGINGTGLQDSSGNQITASSVRARRTDMLSVWRRLHIEVDSMGASDGNFVLGIIPNGQVIYSRRQATLDVNQTLEVNRFENGRLVVGGSFDLDVISNTANTVTVVNNAGFARVIPSNSQFALYDDDDFNDDDGATGDGTLDGDTGEDITEPDTSLLQANSDDPNTNVLTQAYVRPAYDIADTRDNSIFQANVLSDNATDIRPLFVDWDSRSTNTDNAFWTVFLLGSYQHTLVEDGDPSTENPTLGIVDEITNVTGDREGSGALIFLELHRTREFPGYNPAPTALSSMAVAVGHEVGHLFSCVHGDGGLMGTDRITGAPVSNQLSPTMISKIRGLMHP